MWHVWCLLTHLYMWFGVTEDIISVTWHITWLFHMRHDILTWRIYMRHDSILWDMTLSLETWHIDMTHLHETWRIPLRHDSCTRALTYRHDSFTWRLIYMRHDSFTWDMTLSLETWHIDMNRWTEARHVTLSSHVSNEWLVELRHDMWLVHLRHEMRDSCQQVMWLFHFSHVNKSCLKGMSHVSCKWVMSICHDI